MNLFTRIFAALRYPETALGKTLQRIVPIILLVVLLILGFSGFATYRILVPARLEETIDPSSFLLRNYLSLPFSSSDKKSMEGWYIRSIRGAPVVFLCHGYKSNRSELLTLASTFQENGYNLFLFDFRAHGNSPFNMSTLGIRETADLLAAIATITERPDVDANRAGIWGVSLGAFVALSAAAQSERIKALVVDSPFESPHSFLEMQTASVLGMDNLIFRKLARFGLTMVNLPKLYDDEELLRLIPELRNRDKLFITNEETSLLEMQTLKVFNHTPQPKELLRLKHSKTSILYDVERKNYENIVVEFFKKHLPVRGNR